MCVQGQTEESLRSRKTLDKDIERFLFALIIRCVSGDFDEFDFVSGGPKAACIGCAGFATFYPLSRGRGTGARIIHGNLIVIVSNLTRNLVLQTQP
ncbi:hypothetical protein YC2023_053274 [Brassica napus]